MSEYWKSTPKYWCKHCKTYVRDTKLERQQHDSTPRHQGNLKRFVRDLHRNNDREEREKQRAKNEVERLNGIVSRSSSNSAEPPWKHTATASSSSTASIQTTPADRKAQLIQLASMGVAIPDEYRGEMAMAGDWKTLSSRVIQERIKGEEDGDIKLDGSGLSTGVRKRKCEEDEEEEAEVKVVRKGWGSAMKTYPADGDGEDLDALLAKTIAKKVVKQESDVVEGTRSNNEVDKAINDEKDPEPTLKQEGSEKDVSAIPPTIPEASAIKTESSIKTEEDAPAETIVFKKRKSRSTRHKA
ncbi:MAG: hypothetical protein M1834_005826 [Cirrosporium novae-zelandiae]|nr:MAG: hypothetical protein M1834_005826 [Cirrosporium novae-zelandiae]